MELNEKIVNLITELYNSGPFVEKMKMLDLWYQAQAIIMKVKPELVEERKKRFESIVNENINDGFLNIKE